MLLASTCAPLPRGEAPPCEVRTAADPRDEALAREACARAAERFEALFGARAPAGTLVLVDDPTDLALEVRDGAWMLRWQSSRAMREVASRLGREPDRLAEGISGHWSSTVPHEIGHAMYEAHFFPAGLPRDRSEYGTPLPDWIDEAVAIWMETDSARSDRIDSARGRLPEPPPLARILTMEHPHIGEHDYIHTETTTEYPCPSAAMCPDRERWAEGVTITTRIDRVGQVHSDTTYFQGASPPRDPAVEHFYPLALAVLEYVLDRGGREAFDMLEARLREGAPDETILLGLPGLPGDPASLEADWRRWWAGGGSAGAP